ncbi:MAG: CaiB/BaiF CoA-transferase family protein [Chloroflexota bacterium]|nr:CaiB/BaiF CoA-transferase family protein [Chloroflexota bacterium]
MPLALEGIKILDMCWIGPGAFCSEMLGDLGADVIKISDVQMERIGALPKMVFDNYPGLRNCRTMGLDLKAEAGRQVFYDLANTADVLMEGFRPGVVKRLGVDYDTIKAINPRIVYTSLSSYGQDGPYRDIVGHDVNYLAVSGLLGVTGPKGGKPIIPGAVVADWAGAMCASTGILAALMSRERTGKGQFVDVSITDAITEVTSMQINPYLYQRGEPPKKSDTIFSGHYPWYNVYETKNGKYISIATLEPKFFANLCRLLDGEEFIPHQYDEGEKQEEMFSFFREKFLTKTRDEWMDLLMYKDTCFTPVYDIDELEFDSQLIARKMILEFDHPAAGCLKQIGSMHKLSDSPVEVRNVVTRFGQHTAEILAEIGYDSNSIDALGGAGVISR